MKRLLVLLALSAAFPALADGPHIALHATQGAYTATLFTAPDPLVTGKVQFALLVGQGEAGVPVPVREAQVSLTLKGSAPVTAVLTREGKGGLLQGSAVVRGAGTYVLAVVFTSGQATPVQLTGILPVAENHGRRDAVLWSAAVPVIAVLLFLANQHAKQRLRAGRAA